MLVRLKYLTGKWFPLKLICEPFFGWKKWSGKTVVFWNGPSLKFGPPIKISSWTDLLQEESKQPTVICSWLHLNINIVKWDFIWWCGYVITRVQTVVGKHFCRMLSPNCADSQPISWTAVQDLDGLTSFNFEHWCLPNTYLLESISRNLLFSTEPFYT